MRKKRRIHKVGAIMTASGPGRGHRALNEANEDEEFNLDQLSTSSPGISRVASRSGTPVGRTIAMCRHRCDGIDCPDQMHSCYMINVSSSEGSQCSSSFLCTFQEQRSRISIGPNLHIALFYNVPIRRTYPEAIFVSFTSILALSRGRIKIQIPLQKALQRLSTVITIANH